jgi:hypothetical protein
MLRCILAYFIITALTIITSNNLYAGEINEGKWPLTFSGLKGIDTTFARIYSKDEESYNYAIGLVNEISVSFEKITKRKPEKGIIIVVDSPHAYPLFILDKQYKKAGGKNSLLKVSNEEQYNMKYLTREDVYTILATTLPYSIFNSIVIAEENNPSSAEFEEMFKGNDKISDPFEPLVKEPGSFAPWVLCLPTPKCLAKSTKKFISTGMREQMGLSKSLLMKPFLALMSGIFKDMMLMGSKAVVFETWLNRFDLPEDEKINMNKEYRKLIGMDDKSMNNMLNHTDVKRQEYQNNTDNQSSGE